MALTFPTTSLKKPSGVTVLPSGLNRPAFGAVYGFDAQGGATHFNIDVRETAANIRARIGDDVGTIAFGTGTNNIYVYDGTHWQTYYLSSSVAP